MCVCVSASILRALSSLISKWASNFRVKLLCVRLFCCWLLVAGYVHWYISSPFLHWQNFVHLVCALFSSSNTCDTSARVVWRWKRQNYSTQKPTPFPNVAFTLSHRTQPTNGCGCRKLGRHLTVWCLRIVAVCFQMLCIRSLNEQMLLHALLLHPARCAMVNVLGNVEKVCVCVCFFFTPFAPELEPCG